MQHHLLQHFRQNFWHLVDNLEKVKREAVEQQQQQSQQQQQQQPPSVAEADYLRPGSGVGGYSATSDTFGAQFGADESSIRAASNSHQHDRSVEYFLLEEIFLCWSDKMFLRQGGGVLHGPRQPGVGAARAADPADVQPAARLRQDVRLGPPRQGGAQQSQGKYFFSSHKYFTFVS